MTDTLLLSMPGGTEWLLIIFVFFCVYYWIRTLIDIANTKFEDPANKIVWFLMVLFLYVVGALIYNWIGKPRNKIVAN